MTEIEKKAFVVAELKDLERYKMEMRGWAEAGGKNAFGKRRIEQTQSVAKKTKTVTKEETPMVVLKEEVMKQEAGAGEWALIALVVILLFGAKKIPELARGMGKGIREFKDATKEINKEITDVKEDAEKSIKE